MDGVANNGPDFPTTIIIKDAPRCLFEPTSDIREQFSSMFKTIDHECQIEFLKSFLRVRIRFTKPEYATTAKLLVEHHSFNDVKMKPYFAKNIKMAQKSYQDEKGHLKLPPLEKQFLISPPASPPVGWVQHAEMAPVICDFDLMSRLAAFTIDDKYELHEGRIDDKQPTIVVTPCNTSVTTTTECTEDNLDLRHEICKSRPRTPRPPLL